MTDRLRRPRKSILRRPEVLDAVHLVLGDDGRVARRRPPGSGLRWIGRYSVSGSRVMTTAAAWMPSWRRRPSRPRATSMTLLGVGVGLVEAAQLAGHLVAVLELVLVCSKQACSGVSRPMISGGMSLAILVADGVGVAEHPGGVAHRGPGLDGGERDDLGDVVGAVALGRVADHLAAVALVEVHVDVGHLLAARVEEALEEQPVADRVEVDDAQAVGDAAARRRPRPGPTRMLALAGVADEVPDDEEVGREPHVGDDAELVVEPLADLGRQRVAVALPGALEGQVAEVASSVAKARRAAGTGAARPCRTRSRRWPARRSAACCRRPRAARRTGGASRPPTSGSARRRRT